jgi:hypothetical protein
MAEATILRVGINVAASALSRGYAQTDFALAACVHRHRARPHR